MSFVIPNWNHRMFLGRSLRSAAESVRALRDAGIDGEVVVIDDASRDGSQRALACATQMFADVDVRVLPAETNAGLARSRNRGLCGATFRFATTLDADDEVIPENLPAFFDAMQRSQATLLYGNLLGIRADEVETLFNHDSPRDRLYERNFIDELSILHVDRVLELGGYTCQESLLGHEDHELVLHLIALNEKIVFFPMVLGKYYRVDQSMIHEIPKTKGTMQRIFWQRKQPMGALFDHFEIFHPDVN